MNVRGPRPALHDHTIRRLGGDGEGKGAVEVRFAALDAHDQVFRTALATFTAPDSGAARIYAEQRLRDGETLDPDILVQDAVGAALEALRGFDES